MRRLQSLKERQGVMKARISGTPDTTAKPWDGPPPITVQEAATRLKRSDDWARKYFRQFAEVLTFVNEKKKRGVRDYVETRIPEWLFEREWKKLTGSAKPI